jgi:choline dehydrogenase-like flavoprotein
MTAEADLSAERSLREGERTLKQSNEQSKNDSAEAVARIRVNQDRLAANLSGQFDFIVCGAGTSGSVVAGRLAANPAVKVLLLEAGGADELESVMNPNHWVRTLGSELDWGFVTEPNPHLNGRAIPYSMGKVLGGGSSINVGTWSRGHQVDWDIYAAESGDPTWGYEAILDLYRSRIEDWTGAPDPKYRGTGGPIHVQPPADPHPFFNALLEAAESAGLQRFENSSGRLMETEAGCAFIDEIVHDGRRQSVFRSYTYSRMEQSNLTVLTGALVTRILFDRQRAAGVEFFYQGQLVRVATSHEIVLSLGAIQTPKLLMQSGIGDEAELANFHIPVVQKLPGVGRNLHDHVALGCVWEAPENTLPSAPRSQAVCFWKTDRSLDAPNFYTYARPGAAITPENNAQFAPPASSWSLSTGMRPVSRGTIHLTGPNPSDPLRIEANYLADSSDLKHLIMGLERAREIGNAAAFRAYAKREVAPGNLNESDLERFIRDGLVTFWHQCCTAKMGRDAMSVVDGRLKVYGVEGLRVADASILPRVTTGNTMAPCVVIGERAAGLLQEEHGV